MKNIALTISFLLLTTFSATNVVIRDCEYKRGDIALYSKSEKTYYHFLNAEAIRAADYNIPNKAQTKMIGKWMSHNRTGKIIPFAKKNMTSSFMKWAVKSQAWFISSKGDTLNNILVKQGAFRKEVMYLETDMPLTVNSVQYEAFLKQLYNAEVYAKDNKLGIWQQ